jgi:hypothetical protein
MRNTIDLLDGLGRRKLDKLYSDGLTNLTERLGRLNTKRNILVHGEWVLEANILAKQGEAFLACQFLRQVTPLDPEEDNAMANPRNQRERVRYCFTIKRIDGTTRDTDALNIDIGKFTFAMRFKSTPLSGVPQKLLESQPYRVTYS